MEKPIDSGYFNRLMAKDWEKSMACADPYVVVRTIEQNNSIDEYRYIKNSNFFWVNPDGTDLVDHISYSVCFDADGDNTNIVLCEASISVRYKHLIDAIMNDYSVVVFGFGFGVSMVGRSFVIKTELTGDVDLDQYSLTKCKHNMFNCLSAIMGMIHMKLMLNTKVTPVISKGVKQKLSGLGLYKFDN